MVVTTKSLTCLIRPKVGGSFFSVMVSVFRNIMQALAHFAWKVYDIQTRPFFKILIRFFNLMPMHFRTFFKFVWMLFWFPVLVIFYILFSNEFLHISKINCYFAYELKKNTRNN